MKRIEKISSLRALAILLVLGFHFFPSIFPNGYIGVDIFFAISGFLISTIIFTQTNFKKFSLIGFYKNRVTRIYPLFLLTLLASLAFGWVFLFPSEYLILGKHAASSSIFISNFFYLNEAGYFDATSLTKPLLHLWSLSIEWQFYIALPLLILLIKKTRLPPFKTIFTIIVFSFAYYLYTARINPVNSFYFPIARLWEFLIGCLFGIQFTQQKLLLGDHAIVNTGSKTLINIISIENKTLPYLGLVLLATAFIPWPMHNISSAYSLFPIIGACLIIYYKLGTNLSNYLQCKFFILIGNISYALYLIHWPILSFAFILKGSMLDLSQRIFILLISVILAILSTYLIERPLYHFKSNSKWIYFLISAQSLILTIALIIYYSHGAPERVSKETYSILENFSNWPQENYFAETCKKRYGNEFSQFCIESNPETKSRIYLLGDSTSNALYPGLKHYFYNINVVNLARGACPPLLGVGNEIREPNQMAVTDIGCIGVSEKYLSIAKSDKNTKAIILAMAGEAYQNNIRSLASGGSFNIYSKDGHSPNKNEILKVGIKNTLDYLKDTNHKIVFLLPQPRLNFSPAECVRTKISNNIMDNLNCTFKKDDFIADQKPFRDIALEVLKDYPSVIVIDPSNVFCDSETCHVSDENRVLFRDDIHLSIAGSYLMGEELFKKMKKK